MNRIDWVQQAPDYQTKYHVLKWETSHFHEPKSQRMLNSALHQEGAALAVSVEQMNTEDLGIGFGPASLVKSGFGLRHGQKDIAGRENPDAAKGQDALNISWQGSQRQIDAVAAQLAQEQVLGKITRVQKGQRKNTVLLAVLQGGIRNRLKEGASHLKDVYQKQKEKQKRTLFRAKKAERKAEPEKKGTRMADKEETLSMQAQNHYLLDSYDSNGQYHILGK